MRGAWGERRQVQMTRDAAFKRRVRARMTRTGEAYSTARARLDRLQKAAVAKLEAARQGKYWNSRE